MSNYTDDFKREAVRLMVELGRPLKQVSRELGVSPTTLRTWRHQFGPGEPTVSDSLPPDEQIRQLRRELDEVRAERDILKKAVGIFSQMPRRS